MEKNIEITLLYDQYKKLLTDNMRDIFELYYYSDLSLREIGENKKISYQAAHDTVKKVENLLKEYEEKLNIYEMKKDIDILIDNLKEDSVKNKEIDKIMKKYR